MGRIPQSALLPSLTTSLAAVKKINVQEARISSWLCNATVIFVNTIRYFVAAVTQNNVLPLKSGLLINRYTLLGSEETDLQGMETFHSTSLTRNMALRYTQ